MKKKTKYKLIRNAGLVAVTAGLYVASFSTSFPNYHVYSESEIQYRQELHDIKLENISFVNKELYDLLLRKTGSQELTHENLNNIYTLVITNELSNQDFSDLKYLTNLNKLYISNNNIDLNDLYYNSHLKDLNITNGNIQNTACLPNTINRLILRNVTITDGPMITPYYLTYLSMTDTNANQLYLKNPEKLKSLKVEGNVFIDLNILKFCENLSFLELKKCPNVTNGQVLQTLDIKDLYLDDYSTIWLDQETVSKIDFESQGGNIVEEVKILDDIINELNLDNMSNDEKRRAIVSFVIDKLQYDQMIESNSDASKDIYRFYTNLPIYYAVRFSDSISVNYTCLVQALCNRAGLTNYQLFGDNNRTWNNIEGLLVDPLQYDLTGNQRYYAFNENSNYIPNIDAPKSDLDIVEIGYINKYDGIQITFNKQNFKFKIGAYALAVFLINFAYLITTWNLEDENDLEYVEDNKGYEYEEKPKKVKLSRNEKKLQAHAEKLREQKPIFGEDKVKSKTKPLFTFNPKSFISNRTMKFKTIKANHKVVKKIKTTSEMVKSFKNTPRKVDQSLKLNLTNRV